MTTPSSTPLAVLHLDTGREWRGGQQQVLFLSRGLTRRGIRSVIASPAGSPLAERTAASELPSLALDYGGPYAPSSIRALRRLLRLEHWSVVHAHTAHAHSLLFLALRMGNLSGRTAPTVFVARRVDFEPKRDPFTRMKYLARHQQIICVSHGVRAVMAKYGVEESRLHVVHSGVEPTGLSPFPGEERARLRAELALPIDAPVLGAIGQLVPHKGHVHLIEAMKQIVAVAPRARLVILGEGEERAELEASIARHGLGSVVSLPGYLPHARRYLPAFDLYVSSSVEEGLGTSILDASRAGLAVVATWAGGSRETVDDGRTGILVEPGRPFALAQAVTRLLRDPAERARLGAAGPAWIEANFSVDRMVKGTLAVYGAASGR